MDNLDLTVDMSEYKIRIQEKHILKLYINTFAFLGVLLPFF